ncbi:MAG: ABC transporter permease [Trebonia sp.]
MSVIAERRPAAGQTHRPGSAYPRLRTLAGQLVFIVGVLCVWILAYATGFISSEALPSPWAVLRDLVDGLGTSVFWDGVGNTLEPAAVGLLAAVVIGVPVGLVTGTYRFAERSARLPIEFGRAFPVIAILPVMLLIMGPTLTMKAVVVFIACVFPLVIQAQYGARSVSEAVAETVRSYRVPRLLRFRKVVLPAATPSVMTGIRLASTMAVLVAVGVEILTTVPGIGQQLAQAQQDDNPAVAYAYIVTAGVIGYAATRLSELAEARALAWRPPVGAEV